MSAVRDKPEATTVRSFVDLRDFAARTFKTCASGDGYRTARRLLPLLPGPVTVGAVDVDGSGRVEGIDADEFVIVLEGRFTLTSSSGTTTLEAGRSAALPQGTSFEWRASGPTRLVVMTHRTDRGGASDPVAIDESATLETSSPPAADLLLTPTPNCCNHLDYRSANGEFTCGVWDSSPYARRAMTYRHHELMHLLAGAATFVDAAGRSATFVKGDIFLVEQGSHCTWQSEEYVKKVYAIYRPA